MKYTHIIWDFNGTILDDVLIGIDSVNVMLKKRSLPIIEDKEHYRELFCFPIIEYYRRCGFDFSVDDYETVLAPEWVDEYNRREHTAPLCYGIKEALESFKEAGAVQSIVSASSSDMLRTQIERLGIGAYFDGIIGCDNIFAYGKKEALCSYTSGMLKEQILMVGDTAHDYEAAKAADIDCALLLTGHANEKELRKTPCKLYRDALTLARDIIEVD